MITCSNCGNTFKDGNFCPSCGTAKNEAIKENQTGAEQAATTAETKTVHENKQSEEIIQNIRQTGASFKSFFMTLLTSPSNARQATANDLVSGIITLVALAVIVSLRAVVLVNNLSIDIAFIDSFLKPFAKALFFIAIIIVTLIGASTLAKQEINPKEIIAKFGAYSLPFALVLLVSVTLQLIEMNLIATILFIIGKAGLYLIAPILVLSTKQTKRIDFVYLIIIVGIITVFSNFYLEIGTYHSPNFDNYIPEDFNFNDF